MHLPDSFSTLTFAGGLDISRYPELVAIFNSCPDDDSCVIVDLSNAQWIDSIFMTELLVFYRKIHKSGRSMVVVAEGNVARMLTIAGISRRIRVVSNLEDARKSPARLAWEAAHPKESLGSDNVD
jgi:anti-anti-sigma factor